ncbi:hypothetical protein [Rariglobus hedericola]|uniref:Uncharacterized protein n=1 Tax=Rariglobus hedericola TaxID=2597822 RepID=A0A556QGS4_9BACT|nr:hypothetical protein [Rariglobus hedericola]TSJ75837.1 hypothetical protein FPL22_16390 [Rariglobus hedericola]
MKLPHWILTVILSGASLLHAAQPAEFTFMLVGYCRAGNAKDDPNALGGYGGSDNLPKPLKFAIRSPDLYLEIADTPNVVFAEKYTGLNVRLINGGKKTAIFPASDSRISLVQEAQDTDGTWKEIEYLPSSWCGNSYHNVYLQPKHYWEFTAPRYSGPQKTKLRFKLTLAADHILYSPTYEGGIHPEQFTAQQGRKPTNLMDPHTE